VDRRSTFSLALSVGRGSKHKSVTVASSPTILHTNRWRRLQMSALKEEGIARRHRKEATGLPSMFASPQTALRVLVHQYIEEEAAEWRNIPDE